MSKPVFKKWTNPYIDRVESLPGLLAPCYGGKITEPEMSTFTRKISGFETIYSELGCGSGKSLVEHAEKETDACFVGFELRYKRAYKAAAKASRKELKNVFVFRCNAKVLPELFGPASLSGVFVNFPDPWDKKRWEENRILNERMLDSLAVLLKPAGFLSYKTDHTIRFRETLTLLSAHRQFAVQRATEDLWNSDHASENVTTEFEGLFLSKGMKICCLKAVRT